MDEIEQILLPYIDQNKIDRVIVRAPGWGTQRGSRLLAQFLLRNVTGRLLNSWKRCVKSSTKSSAYRRLPLCAVVLAVAVVVVQFVLQGNTYEKLAEYRDIVIEEAAKN